ncbi:MAG: HD family phosphohydrolase [Bacilli bacterium]
MKEILDDQEYLVIVKDILDNQEFNKMRKIEHHGISRFEHSVKVSYRAYKMAVKFNLDYVASARGGLLHDFFLSDVLRNGRERFVSTFIHPKKAYLKAKEIFMISSLEADIIKSHMFPINITIPHYKESWLVIFSDKTIGALEFSMKLGYKFSYAANVSLLVLFNFIK